MERIFWCALSLSLSGALTGAVLLLLHPLTKRWFSMRWNYYIWLLVIARLMLPVHFEMANGLSEAGEYLTAGLSDALGQKQPAAGGWEDEAGQKDVSPEERKSETESGDKADMGARRMEAPAVKVRTDAGYLVWTAGLIWLLGAGISFRKKIRNYRQFVFSIREQSERITDESVITASHETGGRLRMKRTPDVYESPAVSGAITVGVRKPMVILPKEDRNLLQLPLVLHHEFVHVKRRDLWYKWLCQTLLCVHWFNPVLYLVGRQLNIDCELACDEAVLADLTAEGRRAYGNILINAAERNMFFKKNIPSITLLERKQDLKERLKGIVHYKKQRELKILLSVGMVFFLLYLSACGSVEARRNAMPIQLSAERETEGYEEFEESSVNKGEDREDSFWRRLVSGFSQYDLDSFLAETGAVNKHGAGWKMYDDESLIAGEDNYDQWRAYSYKGGGNEITSHGFALNGSDSVLIVRVQEETEIKVKVSFDRVKGKFKIVHVKPDGSVDVINDTGETSTRKITMEKGRNVIKMVGQGAKVRELTVAFPDFDERDFEAVYHSEKEEYADKVLELPAGEVDKEKVLEALVYMEEDEVSEMFASLLERKVPLTAEELSWFFVYSDTELSTRYLTEAVRRGDLIPDKEMIQALMPHLESGGRGMLLEAMGSELDWETLYACLPYLDDGEKKECLLGYLESGKQLTFTQFEQAVPYLNDEIVRELDRYMEGK